jgi:hypothetical protein
MMPTQPVTPRNTPAEVDQSAIPGAELPDSFLSILLSSSQPVGGLADAPAEEPATAESDAAAPTLTLVATAGAVSEQVPESVLATPIVPTHVQEDVQVQVPIPTTTATPTPTPEATVTAAPIVLAQSAEVPLEHPQAQVPTPPPTTTATPAPASAPNVTAAPLAATHANTQGQAQVSAPTPTPEATVTAAPLVPAQSAEVPLEHPQAQVPTTATTATTATPAPASAPNVPAAPLAPTHANTHVQAQVPTPTPTPTSTPAPAPAPNVPIAPLAPTHTQGQGQVQAQVPTAPAMPALSASGMPLPSTSGQSAGQAPSLSYSSSKHHQTHPTAMTPSPSARQPALMPTPSTTESAADPIPKPSGQAHPQLQPAQTATLSEEPTVAAFSEPVPEATASFRTDASAPLTVAEIDKAINKSYALRTVVHYMKGAVEVPVKQEETVEAWTHKMIRMEDGATIRFSVKKTDDAVFFKLAPAHDAISRYLTAHADDIKLVFEEIAGSRLQMDLSSNQKEDGRQSGSQKNGLARLLQDTAYDQPDTDFPPSSGKDEIRIRVRYMGYNTHEWTT